MADYQTQHPGALPDYVVAYGRSPDFTEHNLPDALRKNHNTKPGVWALIHVLEGKVCYRVPAWNHDEMLEPGKLGLVAPQVDHFVEPQGPFRMYVEFHAKPGDKPGNPHQ